MKLTACGKCAMQMRANEMCAYVMCAWCWLHFKSRFVL